MSRQPWAGGVGEAHYLAAGSHPTNLASSITVQTVESLKDGYIRYEALLACVQTSQARGPFEQGDAALVSLTPLAAAPNSVMWQVIIHMTFVVSAIMLAWIDKLTAQSGKKEPNHE